MESQSGGWPGNLASSHDTRVNGRKRTRSPVEKNFQADVSASMNNSELSVQKKTRADSKTVDYLNPYAVRKLCEELEGGKFGSVTNSMKDLEEYRKRILSTHFAEYPALLELEQNLGFDTKKENRPRTPAPIEVIDLDDDDDENAASPDKLAMVVIGSDDVNAGASRPLTSYQEVVLNRPPGEYLMKNFLERDYHPKIQRTPKGPQTPRSVQTQKSQKQSAEIKKASLANENGEEASFADEDERAETKVASLANENGEEASFADVDERAETKGANLADESERDKGEYIGVEESEEGNDRSDAEIDDLDDIWREMNFGLACLKEDTAEDLPDQQVTQDMCDHYFVLKEDIGSVCRVCGVIQTRIEEIIEYQKPKNTRTARSYAYDSKSTKDEGSNLSHDGVKLSEQEFEVAEISAHPRHWKQMKPHQIEGFNFLLSNLVAEKPGGCILAHAPGSGKTFMIISFMQSFLAKYPHARPLVVLPMGILSTWKKEFQRWQVEDIPLLDFYSVKAENRTQQLEVLQQWASQRSILFLSYKQFSIIVCHKETSKVDTLCEEMLLRCPSILVLDEGHTPRNENTDVLSSLKKVQTPRKVVLSGTLYQNHVKEVFNIINLVRPKFLRSETSRSIVKRILSRVPSSRVKATNKENVFYESVEHALQKDENFKRKITVIQDLREMTSKILHFYKGDFLDELPGFVDFTVSLNLSRRQKIEVKELKLYNRKFKVSSEGSALYVHPKLRQLEGGEGTNDSKMDQLLEDLDVREGVKAKFFLNMLNLCESSSEKLLVFSSYLAPIKFLERLTVKIKGWSLGREIFVITGDCTSENREWSMDRFNNSPDARVFFGSIKTCGEGISLVGASRIIILDVHLNPSVTRQAIGRAFRPGQEKKVYTYRLVAAETPEEKDHATCFKKESISKMWFEWNEYCGQQAFDMESVEVNDCGDPFLEVPKLNEDVIGLYKRQTAT